jgi:hypothetical protein
MDDRKLRLLIEQINDCHAQRQNRVGQTASPQLQI